MRNGCYSGQQIDLDSLGYRDLVRFFKKTERDSSGCIVWTAALNSNGYGQFVFRRRNLQAHRVSYALAFEEIPSGKVLRHLCGNKSCVLPEHLKPGDMYANMLDDSSKLSAQDAIAIRKLYLTKRYTYREIGELFGVALHTVGGIVRGERHLYAEREAS